MRGVIIVLGMADKSAAHTGLGGRARSPIIGCYAVMEY